MKYNSNWYSTNFPDEEYLKKLTKHLKKKVGEYQSDKPLDQLVTQSGAALN